MLQISIFHICNNELLVRVDTASSVYAVVQKGRNCSKMPLRSERGLLEMRTKLITVDMHHAQKDMKIITELITDKIIIPAGLKLACSQYGNHIVTLEY